MNVPRPKSERLGPMANTCYPHALMEQQFLGFAGRLGMSIFGN